MAIENDPLLGPLEKDQRKRMCLTFSLQNMGALDKYCKYCIRLIKLKNIILFICWLCGINCMLKNSRYLSQLLLEVP